MIHRNPDLDKVLPKDELMFCLALTEYHLNQI